MKTTQFEDLGLINYKEAWDYQEKLFSEILNIKSKNRSTATGHQITTPNYLLFCEHNHVFTLGKSGSENNLLIGMIELNKINADYYKINRGGDITYHGPGQIVGYPIIDLENFKLDIRTYIFNLEEAVIRTLLEFGITSERLSGATGVWIDTDIPNKTRKICAIGVKASRYVSMHGFAFNINTDLNYFNMINPCGFTDKKASSLEKELGEKVDIENVKSILKSKLVDVFGFELK